MFNGFLNARIGDGSINKASELTHRAVFTSKDKAWIEYKRNQICPTSKIYTIKPHANRFGKSDFYQFTTRVDPRWRIYKLKSVSECIQEITITDLIALYLDNGSWHKNKNVIHLYMSSFDHSEQVLLKDKINKLLGKSPSICSDNKTNGRSYLYIYFPSELTKIFKSKVLEFVNKNELHCFDYKLGLCPYSSCSDLSSSNS